jgi:hypothetical protein
VRAPVESLQLMRNPLGRRHEHLLEGASVLLSQLFLLAALAAQPTNPCLTNPDTVRPFKQQASQTFRFLDTLRLKELGLPVQVATISLVDDSTVCARALDALYAYATNPRDRKPGGAYVFTPDSAGYVVTPANDVNTFTYYDRDWHWLAALAALD